MRLLLSGLPVQESVQACLYALSIKIVFYFLGFIQYKRQKENSIKEVPKLTIRLVCRAGEALVK